MRKIQMMQRMQSMYTIEHREVSRKKGSSFATIGRKTSPLFSVYAINIWLAKN